MALFSSLLFLFVVFGFILCFLLVGILSCRNHLQFPTLFFPNHLFPTFPATAPPNSLTLFLLPSSKNHRTGCFLYLERSVCELSRLPTTGGYFGPSAFLSRPSPPYPMTGSSLPDYRFPFPSGQRCTTEGLPFPRLFLPQHSCSPISQFVCFSPITPPPLLHCTAICLLCDLG